MAKDKRSRDQKRKAKLTERARKQGASTSVEPYGGRKYQRPEWATLMYATEVAIYEVIQSTERRLGNDSVRLALEQLVLQLRAGLPSTLSVEESQPDLVIGTEAPFVMWNIRRNWTLFFEKDKAVPAHHLIGVLRTLLNSIEAHQWHTGRERGYVEFLDGFMQRSGAGEVQEFRRGFDG